MYDIIDTLLGVLMTVIGLAAIMAYVSFPILLFIAVVKYVFG